MSANNKYCGVGVAYNSKIGGRNDSVLHSKLSNSNDKHITLYFGKTDDYFVFLVL